ncbi:SEC14-like protein 5 [Seminavis robusta]|uniref:SEC14-like protein 5 n=1 Tax=Seminavis robusta TaxID=568900 RepID=A0A9N8DEJ5_9STRA|nr:SEC14-like protein 5 [Seminavis robusta]|eukprot:Sro103_g052380.1 SEC14-like protein 5 (375) ;mRNA; f:29999-31123
MPSQLQPRYPTLLPYDVRWQPEQVQACKELWELPDEETSKLMELRRRVADLSHSNLNGPFELVRFVLEHSCHGNIHTMEKRVRQCVEWRDRMELDTVLQTYAPLKVFLQFPFALIQGVDKEGDAVVVIRSGAGDPLSLLQRFGRDELLQGVFWGQELFLWGPWQREYIQKQGRRPKLVTAVIDLKGLNRRHYHPALMLIAQKMMTPMQLHYPHMPKKVLLVNTPGIFRFVWALFKPLVMHHLRMLMEVASEAETEQLLRQHMDLSILPEIMAPGVGKGRAIPGLNPKWEGGILSPSDDDWDRAPLLYGPDDDTTEKYDWSQSTASTSGSSSCYSSLSSTNTNTSPTNPVPVRSAKHLLKGAWTEGFENNRILIT